MAAAVAFAVVQHQMAVPMLAATYTGTAQIDGPLQLSLAVSPPAGAPRDTLQLTLTLRNRTATAVSPDVLIQLPGSLGLDVGRLLHGITLNLQNGTLQWLPVVDAYGAETVTVPLRVGTANLQQPEQPVGVRLRHDGVEKQAEALVWIGLPPQVESIGGAAQVAVEQPMQLEANVIGPDPVQQVWHFGDGRRVAVRNPAVAYPSAGVYTVSVEVTNPLGSATASRQITVVPHAAARFTADDETPGVGQAVTFLNDSGGQGPLRYTWQFGDGAMSNEAHPAHVYQVPGTYQVLLTVENAYGRSDYSGTVTVGQPPTANIIVDASAPAGQQLVGQAVGDPTVTEYAWEMGDGRVYRGDKVSHAYRQTGSYYVTMTASNEFGTTRVGQWVYVEPGMTSVFVPVIGKLAGLQEGVSADSEPGIVLAPVELEGEFSMQPLDIPPGTTPAEQLFIYVNAARAQFGLPALEYVYELSVAAQKHADDMAAFAHTSHTGADGSRPAERLLWFNYPHGYAGEATAWGFEDPRQAVEFWVNSPSHRSIILNSLATDLGVGHTTQFSAPAVWYWTAEFGNRFGSPWGPELRVNSPADGLETLNSSPITFSWVWTQQLSGDQQFVVYASGSGGTRAVGAVAQPSLGMRYALTIDPVEFPNLLGPFQWQVRLETRGGAMLAESGSLGLVIAVDPDLPTPTPPATAVPAASPTPAPQTTPTPQATPQPTETAVPPATQPTSPPLPIIATPSGQ